MFVYNRTDHHVVCKRGELHPRDAGRLCMAAFMSTEVHRPSDADRGAQEGASGRHPNGWEWDPTADVPSAVERARTAPAWIGTSVTVSGFIRMPERGALARRVRVRVGGRSCELVARGRRHWIRDRHALVPSAPASWEPLTMSWTEAFGGGHDVPAGREATAGLPYPAHHAAHPTNPSGKGFFTSAEHALDKEVPRIELLDDQLIAFGQMPIPGCFGPCDARGAGLRLPLPKGHPLAPQGYASPLAMAHSAPAYMIFPWQAEGTAWEVEGFEGDARGLIPSPQIVVRAHRRAGRARYGARLRALHIDTNTKSMCVVWQHLVLTPARALPDIEIVNRREELR